MQAALEQAPEVLKPISVYATVYILLCVVNDLVRILLIESPVSVQFVGINRGTSGDVTLDYALQRFLRAILNDFGANLPATLKNTHHGSFVCHVPSPASDTPCPHALVHVPRFAADKSLIDFNLTAHFAAKEIVLQRQADTVKEKPCRLLSDPQISCNLVTANTVLAVGNKPHSRKPLVQTNRGIFHDGADLDGEFALGVMATALPSSSLCAEADLVRSARWADNALRPTSHRQIVNAIVRIGEEDDCFLKALRFVCHD